MLTSRMLVAFGTCFVASLAGCDGPEARSRGMTVVVDASAAAPPSSLPHAGADASPVNASVLDAATARPVRCDLTGTFVGLGSPDTIAVFAREGAGVWHAKGPTSGGNAYLAPTRFRWTLDEDTALLSFDAGDFHCHPNEDGRYTVTFDECRTVHLALVHDACAARARALDGATGRRR
jgi:hypothetical protein